MRIKNIQEKMLSIVSAIKNAYFDFSKMTVSVVAIETDVLGIIREAVNSKPLIL